MIIYNDSFNNEHAMRRAKLMWLSASHAGTNLIQVPVFLCHFVLYKSRSQVIFPVVAWSK